MTCSCSRHNRSLIPTWFATSSLLFLLLISSSSFHAEGRSRIGSRPPRCDTRRCVGSCERCEAVQVPVNPQAKRIRRAGVVLSSSVSGTEEYGGGGGGGEFRYDYKPMRWQCKCGNSIFSP
ncbi:EPIDERMAL PATTERNING FACTOR-like protein 2 [Linum grandiflorum]